MAEVPNPFDPAEVEKFMEKQEASRHARSQRVKEQAEAINAAHGTGTATPAAEVMGNADLMGADTPAAEAVVMLNYWAAAGAEAYAEAVGAILTAISATAEELDGVEDVSVLDVDNVLISARLGKSIEAVGKKLYTAGRTSLWRIVGGVAGKQTTPNGEKFRFTAPSKTSTRVDSKLLKAEYPDVYDKVAKTVVRSTEAPGTLYL